MKNYFAIIFSLCFIFFSYCQSPSYQDINSPVRPQGNDASWGSPFMMDNLDDWSDWRFSSEYDKYGTGALFGNTSACGATCCSYNAVEQTYNANIFTETSGNKYGVITIQRENPPINARLNNQIDGNGDTIYSDNAIMCDGLPNLRPWYWSSANMVRDKYIIPFDQNTQDIEGYGFLEIDLVLAKGRGFYSAFWTFGKFTCGFPNELDIMEMGGGHHEFTTSWPTNYHWADNLPTCDGRQSMYIYNGSTDLSLEWHTYGIEYGPNYLVYYLDDKIIRYAWNSYIKANPMHAIVGINISPWPWEQPSVNPSITPSYAEMLVDNYRFYKYDVSQCGVVEDFCNFPQGAITGSVKNSWIICNMLIQNQITMRAVNKIDFYQNVTINPNGKNFIAQVYGDCPTY